MCCHEDTKVLVFKKYFKKLVFIVPEFKVGIIMFKTLTMRYETLKHSSPIS